MRDMNQVCYDKVLKQVKAGYQVSPTYTCRLLSVFALINEGETCHILPVFAFINKGETYHLLPVFALSLINKVKLAISCQCLLL